MPTQPSQLYLRVILGAQERRPRCFGRHFPTCWLKVAQLAKVKEVKQRLERSRGRESKRKCVWLNRVKQQNRLVAMYLVIYTLR